MKNTLLKTALVGLVSAVALVGCQTHTPKPKPTQTHLPNAPIAFSITGKIGVRSQTAEGVQAGSAFYAWSQQDKRFAIDLTGALGIGATSITFDGQTAKLVSERTGEIQATSPEALLQQATGWQAPISQLPYWIVARPAPSDSQHTHDKQGRLATATNGDWQAQFEYQKSEPRPNRLRITHSDGHQVILTISDNQ